MDNFRDRFFAKVQIAPSGCHQWTACKSGGYGRFGVNGRPRLATHVAWFLEYGHWPQQPLLHTCDNPGCVRPSHLYEGDAKQNQADCIARGRKPRAGRLTPAQVDEIRQLAQTRTHFADIAAKFGVSPGHINAVIRRRTWDDGRLPARKPRACRAVEVGGEQLTIKQIAARAGVSQETVRARLARGLTGAQLIAAKHRAKRKPYTRS